jgi:hypothetical protein
MKKLFAAAALAALMISSPAPAQASTECTTEESNYVCFNPKSGAYSVQNLTRENVWIEGKCGEGGGAKWDGLPFPAAEEIHAIFCPGHSLSPV